MKRIICLLLVLALAAGVTACSTQPAGEETTPSAPVTEPTESQTQPTETNAETSPDVNPAMPENPEDLVSDARSEHLVYDDDAGNHYDLELSIPQINAPTPDAGRINKQIEEFLSAHMDSAVASSESGASAVISSMSYDYWLDDEGRLTLLVEVSSVWESVEYRAYTIDSSTGKEIGLVAMGQILGLSGDEMKAAMEASISAYFASLYSALESDDPELYAGLLEDTTSIRNINAAQVYIDRNGDPYIICDIYSPAGAVSYQHVFPLVTDAESRSPRSQS